MYIACYKATLTTTIIKIQISIWVANMFIIMTNRKLRKNIPITFTYIYICTLKWIKPLKAKCGQLLKGEYALKQFAFDIETGNVEGQGQTRVAMDSARHGINSIKYIITCQVWKTHYYEFSYNGSKCKFALTFREKCWRSSLKIKDKGCNEPKRSS